MPPAPWVPRVAYLGEHLQQPFADRHGFRLPIASAHSVSTQPASTTWALEGRFGAHHGLLLGEMLARIDHMDEAICRLSQEVARRLAPFSPLLALLRTIPGGSAPASLR